MIDRLLKELGPVPPRDWTGRDSWGDPEGYEGIVDDPDPGNYDDMRHFGAERERHRIWWMIFDMKEAEDG